MKGNIWMRIYFGTLRVNQQRTRAIAGSLESLTRNKDEIKILSLRHWKPQKNRKIASIWMSRRKLISFNFEAEQQQRNKVEKNGIFIFFSNTKRKRRKTLNDKWECWRVMADSRVLSFTDVFNFLNIEKLKSN